MRHETEDEPREDEPSESSEEGSQDDDEEPRLKYARIEGSTVDILSRDAASALAVNERFIVRPAAIRANRREVLGTHAGNVFVLSDSGDLIKRFRPHRATVNDLSVDAACEHIASASVDGPRSPSRV